MSHEETETAPPPLLRIVKGNPKPDEVAALVAVVSAMAAGAAEAAAKEQRPRSEWSAPHRRLRATHVAVTVPVSNHASSCHRRRVTNAAGVSAPS